MSRNKMFTAFMIGAALLVAIASVMAQSSATSSYIFWGDALCDTVIRFQTWDIQTEATLTVTDGSNTVVTSTTLRASQSAEMTLYTGVKQYTATITYNADDIGGFEYPISLGTCYSEPASSNTWFDDLAAGVYNGGNYEASDAEYMAALYYATIEQALKTNNLNGQAMSYEEAVDYARAVVQQYADSLDTLHAVLDATAGTPLAVPTMTAQYYATATATWEPTAVLTSEPTLIATEEIQ